MNTFRKAALAVIEYESEAYLTATEVARRFNISRGTCHSNILKHMKAYYLPGRKNALYRQPEVEQLSEVRVIVVRQQSMPIATKQETRSA